MIERYAQWLIKNRWLAIILSVVMVLILASGARFLAITNDYRVFFGPDNPQLLAFEEVQRTYTKADNILIMLEPQSGNVFEEQTMKAVLDLTDRAWQVPYSVRVDSVSNYQHMKAIEDDLEVADLFEEYEGLSEQTLSSIKAAALSQPQIVRKIISPSGDVTGVNITIEVPEPLSEADMLLPKAERMAKDPAVALAEAMNYARNMVDEMRSAYPSIEFRTTGIMAMNHAFPESIEADAMSIIPLAFLVILVGVMLLLGSPMATFGTIIVVFMSILAAMGAAGWVGIDISPPAASAPTVIMTLAVADCIHLLVTILQNMRNGDSKFAAIAESLRINFSPIFLTSLTTAIGFLSMNFSDSPPFHDLGNITAMGVMAAFFLSIFFLPALMAVLPIKVKTGESTKGRLMNRFSDFVIAKQKPLLWCSLVVMLALAALAPRNELNDIFVNYFDETVPFRADTDHIAEKLTGLYIVEYSLNSGVEGGVSDPSFLASVEKLERYLQSIDSVQHVSAITETMRRLNRSMHGDDDAYKVLPESRELSAQYLLLYEMSLPYGLDLNNQINFDKSKTRIIVTTDTMSTQQVLAFDKNVQEWMQENTPDIVTPSTGTTVMFTNISIRNIKSMLLGTSIALILISLVLLVSLRSVKFGLISLIPNIAPAVMGFGIWSILVGEVSLAVSVVVAMTLGIVVDDTIHYLSKYLRARRERGMSAEEAVRYAFNTVGVALVVTTVVLACGFMVIAQSNFLLNSQMGLLTAITIVIALLVDFLFLPPFLMAVDKDKNEQKTDGTLQQLKPSLTTS